MMTSLKRMSTLTVAVFLVCNFDPSTKKMSRNKEPASWHNADFDSFQPKDIMEYVQWANDSACHLYQGT